MSDRCKQLHEQLENLPIYKYPFDLDNLPLNGIYFFYENGEIWGHGGNKDRIVRIGSHRQGNFRNRINEHFLLNEKKMVFNKDKPKPSDRSIFRKNIGRVLLYKDKDEYLYIWEKNFTTRANRNAFSHLRDINKEKEIEEKITRIIREDFNFRCIPVEDEAKRLGDNGLENEYIRTISGCSKCKPSKNWLGQHSPIKKIRESAMWLVQYIKI